MDLLEIGAELLSQKLGLAVDRETIGNALQGLVGDGSGGVDVAGLAGKFASSGGIGDALKTWLGDGENAPISAQSILDALGRGEVANFADRVGTDTETAAAGLSDVLPQLLDKASSGGDLLASFGGASGLMGMAKSFLR